MEHSVARRLGAHIVPSGLDAPQKIADGGQHYVENCAVCHGRPDAQRTQISQGLNPAPPDLFRATRHPDEQENFQFIKHGVKMTGMPGFGPTETDDQVWVLVAFLDLLPGMSAADFTSAVGAQPVSVPASGG